MSPERGGLSRFAARRRQGSASKAQEAGFEKTSPRGIRTNLLTEVPPVLKDRFPFSSKHIIQAAYEENPTFVSSVNTIRRRIS